MRWPDTFRRRICLPSFILIRSCITTISLGLLWAWHCLAGVQSFNLSSPNPLLQIVVRPTVGRVIPTVYRARVPDILSTPHPLLASPPIYDTQQSVAM